MDVEARRLAWGALKGTWKQDYYKLCGELYIGETRSFAKFGDGEFLCMLGHKGRNCDRHEYYPDLGLCLRKVWAEHKPYWVGVRGINMDVSGLKAGGQVRQVYASMMHYAQLHQLDHVFWEAIKGREVVIVGPLYMSHFGRKHVVVPQLNCWKDINHIRAGIKEAVGDVVLYAAGMASKVLIHEFAGDGRSHIDCGSFLDPYCGRETRSYHKQVRERLRGATYCRNLEA